MSKEKREINVLLVDYEILQLKIVTKLLHDIGKQNNITFNIATATNAKDAILKDLKFDLVITDRNMTKKGTTDTENPELMNGECLIRHLKGKREAGEFTGKIIGNSGDEPAKTSGKNAENPMITAGADSFLVKPINSDKLLPILKVFFPETFTDLSTVVLPTHREEIQDDTLDDPFTINPKNKPESRRNSQNILSVAVDDNVTSEKELISQSKSISSSSKKSGDLNAAPIWCERVTRYLCFSGASI